MPTIKIHPPKQLPEHSLSQQEFEDWTNELEIYLGQDEAMARFMTGGIYETWTSQEANPNRIPAVLDLDPNLPADDAANRPAVMAELLAKRRRAGISKCRNSFQIQTSKWAHFSPIMVFSDLLRLSGNYLSSSPTWLTAPPTSHMKGLLSLVEWFLSQLAIVYNLRAAFH